jgi:hypothetical protein
MLILYCSTIKWMQYRKMRRAAKSSMKPKKGTGLIWVVIFIAIYIGCAVEIALEGLRKLAPNYKYH